MLVASSGPQPSSGYEIQIRSVRHRGEKLIVRVEEVAPPATQGTLTVITYPLDLVTVRVPGFCQSLEIHGTDLPPR